MMGPQAITMAGSLAGIAFPEEEVLALPGEEPGEEVLAFPGEEPGEEVLDHPAVGAVMMRMDLVHPVAVAVLDLEITEGPGFQQAVMMIG